MSTGLDAAVVVRRDAFVLDAAVTVAPSEVVAVLGPNGAGKSTLLRAVCGLTPVDEGRIALGTTVVDEPGAEVWVDPAARRVGVVFQDYRLFPHLSVVDNVAFGPRSAGSSRAASRDAPRARAPRRATRRFPADGRPSGR